MHLPRSIALNLAAATVGRSVRIRSALLWSARAGGWLRRKIRSGVPKLVLLYVAAAILVVAQSVLTAPDSWQRWQAFDRRPSIVFDAPLFFQSVRWFLHGTTGPWVIALAVAALMAACEGAWRMRKRIVIVSFTDLTGEDPYKALANSLSRRLMTQLSEITDVYQHVSSDPADLSIQTDTRRLALAVNPASDAFAGLTASMKGQEVKFGPFTIPLEWTVTTLSTLLRGPKIGGSVQKSSRGLMLEASIAGGGYSQTWRVTEDDVKADRIGGESDAAIADRMISQLGYRVFTNLNRDEIGTLEWRAGQHYTEGLRAFRQAQRARGDTAAEVVALQRAGQQFLLAYREDKRFLRSLYNLGVINSYQKVKEAAFTVFETVINHTSGAAAAGLPGRRAFKRDREDLARTHYVAAVEAWDLALDKDARFGLTKTTEYWTERAEYHCDMALSLQPWHGEAASMRAEICGDTKDDAIWSRKACAISWSKLCSAAISGNVKNIELAEAVSHVAKLAEHQTKPKTSIGTLKQAVALEPEVDDRWFTLGTLYSEVGDRIHALEAFRAANRESEKALYWLCIACTERGMEPKPPVESAAWHRVLEILEGDLGQLQAIASFWDQPEKRPCHGAHPSAGELLRGLAPDEWKLQAQRLCARGIEIQQVQVLVSQPNAGLEAVQKLLPPASGINPLDRTKLIDWLRTNYQGLEARHLSSLVLYQALRFWNGPPTMSLLRLIQATVHDHPLNSLERQNLAALYLISGFIDLAKLESTNSMSLSPDLQKSAELLYSTTWKRFLTVPDKGVRREAIREIVSLYRDLADSAAGSVWTFDPQRAGIYHFYLATASFELLDYKTAQQSFEISVACGNSTAEALQYLALVYFRCGAFEEAERAYLRLESLSPSNQEEAIRRTLQLALAANHTAAAMAEQGLIGKAWARWLKSKYLSASLQGSPLPYTTERDRLNWEISAHSLCEGTILLAAATSPAFWAESLSSCPRFETTPQELLKSAIEALTRSMEPAIDTAVRADALYRIGVACREMARLDSANAELWKQRGLESLQGAEKADRRDEYADRIARLRQSMAGNA